MAKQPKNLELATDGERLVLLENLSLKELQVLYHSLWDFLRWDAGLKDPDEEMLETLASSIPMLSTLIDFSILKKRLSRLDEFHQEEKTGEILRGVPLALFATELRTVQNEISDRIQNLGKSPLEKAEAWLFPIAQTAGADSDIEAAIYFASRGINDAYDSEQIRERWYDAVCNMGFRRAIQPRVTDDVKRRAESRELSLAEAAEVMRYGASELFSFFNFWDNESETYNSVLYRAVEWLDLHGFKPWTDSIERDFKAGPSDGFDEPYALYWLLFLCRSTSLINRMPDFVRKSWVWSVSKAHLELNEKPWQYMDFNGQKPEARYSVFHAAAIAFIWARLDPSTTENQNLSSMLEWIVQAQRRSGGWPSSLHYDESEIETTCIVMHALSMLKPKGWEKSVALAEAWLVKQQDPHGLWVDKDGPAVLTTVLALDALSIIRGGPTTMSGPAGSEGEGVGIEVTHVPVIRGYVPEVPEFELASKADVPGKPTLLLPVAVDREMKHLLSRLKPMTNEGKVLQVTHGSSTYYHGFFGSQHAVVVKCEMGADGPAGSTVTVSDAIQLWDPLAVVMLGIAFGDNPSDRLAGDVLVSKHIIEYENQKIGDKEEMRGSRQHASVMLLDRFRNGHLGWQFNDHEGRHCNVHFGNLLSGAKLINNEEYRNNLLDANPGVIGGEMEGVGIWAACDRKRKDWIIVKSVCDWADGQKNDHFQDLAAASSVSLAEHVFDNPYVFQGVRDERRIIVKDGGTVEEEDR